MWDWLSSGLGLSAATKDNGGTFWDNQGGSSWLYGLGDSLKGVTSSTEGGSNGLTGLVGGLGTLWSAKTASDAQKSSEADSDFYKNLALQQYNTETEQTEAAQAGLDGVDLSGFDTTNKKKTTDYGRNLSTGV